MFSGRFGDLRVYFKPLGVGSGPLGDDFVPLNSKPDSANIEVFSRRFGKHHIVFWLASGQQHITLFCCVMALPMGVGFSL